ncbi:trehalose-phosphatase [uncultured Croceicoccus sp.]|uniref:trehalose-phosphatase n=1 Tax=uncultured Croceicoccus sp. TaxID=1295329 RepID=UPI002633ACAD|nr:trehalose-phosphatase [uncultured Croceicoccus sp.]
MTQHLPPPPPIDFYGDALFLDFDGTLVELADRPDGVVVGEPLITLLHALSDRLDGRLALVSGRDIATLDGFGMDGLAIAGSHGAEWRLADGTLSETARPPGMDDARGQFERFADTHDGVLFEDKPLGAALHYRLSPEWGDECVALAENLAQSYGFHVQHGHEMVELRRAGVDKGVAISDILERAPFAGHRPIFLGDDVTDEAGFEQVTRSGGHGVLIGTMRATAANFRLPDVNSVNEWLDRSLRN